jgi:hypothetical protein
VCVGLVVRASEFEPSVLAAFRVCLGGVAILVRVYAALSWVADTHPLVRVSETRSYVWDTRRACLRLGWSRVGHTCDGLGYTDSAVAFAGGGATEAPFSDTS